MDIFKYMDNRRLVNILWTGGLDSTFRVLELSQMNIEIQPWYIIDPVRVSSKYELNAMNKITRIIRLHPRTKAIIHDVRYITLKEIKEDEEITSAFKRLHDKYLIGHQYDYIARYARQNNIRFEMSLEKSDRSKAVQCIEAETNFNDINNTCYNVHRIDPSASTHDGCLIFANIDFPISLWNITKPEEIMQIKEMGHENTITHTWFCHNPVFGLPCGHCNPCKDALYEGMDWRVPLAGRLLYWIYKPFYSIYCRLK